MTLRPPSPASIPSSGAVVPLVRSFRFVHEPVQPANAARFVGRDGELAAFVERLIFSHGGSFLVTGYRGVGKTSFVNLALSRLEGAARAAEPVIGEPTRIVAISLNIARPVQPAELMHHIVRRLHERLIEMDIFPLLDAGTREALTRAYDRTSFNMARKQSESSERSYGVGEAGLTNTILGATAKLSWNAKHSRTQNYEMTFLGYDDRAAEHDIISIARALCAGYTDPMSRGQRLARWLRGASSGTEPRTALKIIFVFDELDKLEEFTVGEGKDRRPVIDDILGSLKNLFTTSGVTFVFVAGKDLQERWLEDVGKGDSVYESVFTFDRYLPCLWGDTFSICDQLVNASTTREVQVFDRFKSFLAYKGRGIPRRIVRTFNEYVSWRDNQPMLVFSRPQLNRIAFFAGLHDALEQRARDLFGDSHEESTGTQSDKRRLGVYYLVDWIMRQGRDFTLVDVVNASKKLSAKIALAEEIAPRVIERLITALIASEYLQEVPARPDAAVIGAPGTVPEKRYEVPPRRMIEMGGTGNELEEDSQLLSGLGPSAGAESAVTSIGAYRIIEPIGEGGMGNVYRATDDASPGRIVAIKTIRRELTGDRDIRLRFEREAKVMSMLSHPNLVRFLHSGSADGQPYIAMEYLDGVTLDRIIDALGSLDLPVAVAIVRGVAEGMHYLHGRGIVRNDLKPANVMILSEGRVCLLDFGISKFADEPEDAAIAPEPSSAAITAAGGFVGTPRYMAPELLESRPADPRTDVYALGVMLYQMLTRSFPFDAEQPFDIYQAKLTTEPIPPSRYVSMQPAVEAVILRCLAREPDERFATMIEMEEALLEAAGGAASVDLGSLVTRARERARSLEAWGRDATMTGAGRVAAPPPAAAPRSRAPDPRATVPHAPAPPSNTPPDPASITLYPSTPATPVRANVTDPAIELAQTAPSVPPMRYADAGDVPAASSGKPSIVPLPSPHECDIALVPDGDAFVLKPRETTFGRVAQNDIVLLSPRVSRYHGRFVVSGNETFVETFSASNGIQVNGEDVEQRRLLRRGDVAVIGDMSFMFTT